MISSKKQLKSLTAILVAFVLISFAGCKYFQSNNSVEEDLKSLENGVNVNIPFPDVDLVDSSNKPFPNENLKEGRVLLVVLSAGCDACSDEVSIISNIQKRSGWDTKVWGIVQESPNELSEFHGKGVPIIVDKGVFGILKWPTSAR